MFGGIGASDAKRPKELEAERAVLKKLRAEPFFGDEVVDSVL